jgi:calcineurin-like phosphoesterase family protein
MRRIFVVSDTHFNHANILKFLDEEGKHFRGDKFKDATEMNKYMVACWNKVVTHEDIVYHLGDVYFGPQKEANELLHRLNGHKRLILGNHDDGKDTVLHQNFEEILGWRVFKEFKCVLTHVPVHTDSLGNPKITRNIHGHIHQRKIPDERYVNVSVEQIDYTPKELGTF